jgi:selenocysteine lyase/cysteine desulfurase
MPEQLPEQGEAGTANVPGIAGLTAGMKYLLGKDVAAIGAREAALGQYCSKALGHMGIQVISGSDQAGVVSILPRADCEDAAMAFSKKGFALRGGLHCAPLAHESAGTVQTGTLRLSTGPFTTEKHCQAFLHAAGALQKEGIL